MLLLVDLALALVGRINAQVQMVTVAFPLKMALAYLDAGVDAGGFSPCIRTARRHILGLLAKLMAR